MGLLSNDRRQMFSSIANMGPALGDAGVNFASLSDTAKLILSFAMLIGRLEIYTVLVLFLPDFWKA